MTMSWRSLGLTSTGGWIDSMDGPLDGRSPPMAVTVLLEDELDVGRGDMLCRRTTDRVPGRGCDGVLARDRCAGTRRQVRPQAHDTVDPGSGEGSPYRLDVNTLHRDEANGTLELNEIREGPAPHHSHCSSTVPQEPQTGSFILIDGVEQHRGHRDDPRRDRSERSLTDVRWHDRAVSRDLRAGLTSGVRVGRLVDRPLEVRQVDRNNMESSNVSWSESGRAAYLLDGDNLRHGLQAEPGILRRGPHRRNIRRMGESPADADAGLVSVVPQSRRSERHGAWLDSGEMSTEIPVRGGLREHPLAVCEQRDPRVSTRGPGQELTGGDHRPPYEPPSGGLEITPVVPPPAPRRCASQNCSETHLCR